MKKLCNTPKTPAISWKFTVHNFVQCALSYCVETVCAFVVCVDRMPAVVRLQIGDWVAIQHTTLENKGYNKKES